MNGAHFRKRNYLIAAIMLSLSAVLVAGLSLAQKARKRQPQRPAPTSTVQKQPISPDSRPIREPDPNRAPQDAIDEALFSDEEFFGTNSSVMRPFAAALDRISSLSSRYPSDATLRLHASRLASRLGRFDQAAQEMIRYTELRKRSPDSLRRLAAFYHDRAQYADEVRVLVELARAVPVGERALIYKKAADLVRTRALTEFNPTDFFAELVAADSANIQPVKDYVQELMLEKQYAKAQAILESHQPKFAGHLAYFLSTRARIHEINGDRKAAEAVYASVFEPAWPREVVRDYLELLRRFGRYRVVRRGLQQTVQAGATDLPTIANLFAFYSYETNYAAAGRLIRELEGRRAMSSPASPSAGQPQPVAGDKWTRAELQTTANMLASIGEYDQASRYLYTLYLLGGLQPESREREDALYRLFKVLTEARQSPTRVGGGDLSFYRDIAQIDQRPGFLNAALSLILSDTGPAEEFAAQEREAAGYFNRAFAHRIFNAVKREYPQSEWLDDMYLGSLGIFVSLKEHKRVIDTGREFQARFPDSPLFEEVSLRIADAFVAVKDRAGERSVLSGLLDRLADRRAAGVPLLPFSSTRWRFTPEFERAIDRVNYDREAYSDTYDPTDRNASPYQIYEQLTRWQDDQGTYYRQPEHSQGPSYSEMLERYVSSLAAENKKTETVAFFWGEIKKHPDEEGLYERFFRWLGQAQLVDEQLAAYNEAIRRFDSNTWYHRLARWYVRQKRGRELTDYSRKLISVFDEEEVANYLVRFAGYGSSSQGDQLNWSGRLAFDLYSYAHNRFPRNLFFVKGMLSYLSSSRDPADRAQWEKLSAQYYFADRSIREPYLASLSSQGRLRPSYQEAKSRAGASPGAAGVDLGANFSYRVFAADAAVWLSHHEEAVEVYRDLNQLYPGEPQYAARLSDITRSLGQQADRFYEESAGVLVRMAELHPSDHSYRVKAGEVFAELGDFTRAGEQWSKLIALEPGDRNTYLEVATVYWDYYQFDQAIRVFQKLRELTGDRTIYAYRLGAVYEGKGDMNRAIAEYVKVLSEPGEGRDTVVNRLSQLSSRRGLADTIAAQYRQEREQRPDEWQLVIGYAAFLNRSGRHADALAFLRAEVARSTDVAFLESIREAFRFALRPEDEQLVLDRLVSVARDERESMMYRLQLASFLERHRQIDSAVAIIDRLVSEHPTNVGVIEESERFYWRAGMHDRSLDLFKQTIARAKGSHRRALVLQYARRQSEAGRLNDAEFTLRSYYQEDKSDTEVFSELVKTLGAAGKLAELAEFYKAALEEAKSAGLPRDAMEARLVSIREGMIRTFDSLGGHQDAIDQHIELVNLLPEDPDRLAAAMAYAERHNLTDRLRGYYEKLSKESYKNYRWQLVLGRIYEWQGNLEGAAEQYRIALSNSPQRNELRSMLASVLVRPVQGRPRYDEAIAVLRDAWSLSGKAPEWLAEVAQIQMRQGNRDEAAQTMREALAAQKNLDPDARMKIAAKLAAWGLTGEAAALYESTFEQILKSLADNTASYEDVAGYIAARVRVDGGANAFAKVENLRERLRAIIENSEDTDRYHAETIVNHIDSAMRSRFGQEALEYSDAAVLSRLSSAIRAATEPLQTYGDRDRLTRYLGIAAGASLVDVEEQIRTRLKDLAFAQRTQAGDTACYSELQALVRFYNERGAFLRGADVLVAQEAQDRFKSAFNYAEKISAQYRLSGDQARELEWLRRFYSTRSGNLVTDNNETVERYLAVLYSTGKRDELEQVTRSYNPYQLQVINFLIEKNEKDLARKAIQNAGVSTPWVASRSAEVGLFLKDRSPETEAFFRRALAFRTIGEAVEAGPGAIESLTGPDWFVAARNYAYWLALANRSEVNDYLAGEVERRPRSAAAYLELAAFHLDRKEIDDASKRLELAAELDPNATTISVMRGEIEWARGNRSQAVEAWRSLVDWRASGRLSIADARAFLNVMSSHALLVEALPQLEDFVIAAISRGRGDGEEVESIKPLVQAIAAAAGEDSRLVSAVADSMQRIINQTPDDLLLGRMLVEEDLLPAVALTGVIRSLHQRMTQLAAAVAGTDEYENGYEVGGEYFYPARELAEWRKRFVDHLLRLGAFDEAELLIRSIESEQRDLASETGATEESRYDWIPLASAFIDIRKGRDPLPGLRDYCGLSSKKIPETDFHRAHNRSLRAYALLVSQQRYSEADSLLYDAYKTTLTVRPSATDAATFIELARIEAQRGNTDEARRLLRSLVERSIDNLDSLRLAAGAASRSGLLDDAITFRSEIARVLPEDAVNKMEMARLLDAKKQPARAVEALASLVADPGRPNSVQAQSAELIGQIVRTDNTQASVAARLLEAGAQRTEKTDPVTLALASIEAALNRTTEAESLLSSIRGPLEPVAKVKLARMQIAAGRNSEAISSLERALYLDPGALTSNAIAFSAANGDRDASGSAVATLVLLYNLAGRDEAALETAGITEPAGTADSRRRPLITVADEEKTAVAIFDPVIRSKPPLSSGLMLLAELNHEALVVRPRLLSAVADSALKLGRSEQARRIHRARLNSTDNRDEQQSIEKLLADIANREKIRQRRLGSLLRVDLSTTTESFYSARIRGQQ